MSSRRVNPWIYLSLGVVAALLAASWLYALAGSESNRTAWNWYVASFWVILTSAWLTAWRRELRRSPE